MATNLICITMCRKQTTITAIGWSLTSEGLLVFDTGAMLYQLSYEATDVGSRSIVGSFVPVKEMSDNDLRNKSYMNCGNEINMKK